MSFNVDETTRQELLGAVLGNPNAAYDNLLETLAKMPMSLEQAKLTKVLEAQSKGEKPEFADLQLAVVALSAAPASDDPQPRDLEGLTADQMRRLFKAKNVDLFAGLQSDRTFAKVLSQTVESTYKNAFDKIFQESAQSAVREAALELLRECYISIAAGSKLSDLVKTIEGKKPGGGQEGGDGTSGRAGMP